MALWRVSTEHGYCLAVGDPIEGPRHLLEPSIGIDALLGPDGPGLADIDSLPVAGAVPADAQLACPLGTQDVWAAGVTYERSLEARLAESQGQDVYDYVYTAKRPELFLKSTSQGTRGPGEHVRIRSDSDWDVPEPELGLVIDCDGEVVGFVIGNDMSSRAIEAENALYLPQAKVYTDSCAIGPCLVPADQAPSVDQMTIRLTVHRGAETALDESASVATMVRSPEELASWLTAALEFPHGVVLLTGTGIVPPEDFTLKPNDRVDIEIDGLGLLTNSVALLEVRL